MNRPFTFRIFTALIGLGLVLSLCGIAGVQNGDAEFAGVENAGVEISGEGKVRKARR